MGVSFHREMKGLPIRRVKRVWNYVKVHTPFFTKEWPEDPPDFHMDEPAEDVEDRLRRKHHYEGMEASFHYKGQVADLRRPEGLTEDDVQLEVHLRAREPVEGESVWIGHIEASRYEHMDDHIDEDFLRWLNSSEVGYLLGGGSVWDGSWPKDTSMWEPDEE